MTHCMLIDGSGILYRSYFGLPELTDRDGNDIRVLFGFAKVLLNLMKTNPDKLAIAWDEKGKTIRHTEFDDYKATRQKMPDDMARQIPLTKQLLHDLGIPSYSQPGYEADDVLATWVGALAADHTISVVSADKDLKQLITPTVCWQDPFRQTKQTHANFLEEYGFDPIYFGEYLTLIGDSSDNIPGVAGIGPKTAIGLIQDHLTIAKIYENIEKIKPAIKAKLLENRENAFLSHELIRLRDVPDQVLSVHPILDRYDNATWKKIIIEHHGFNSLADTIDSVTKNYTGPQAVSLFG